MPDPTSRLSDDELDRTAARVRDQLAYLIDEVEMLPSAVGTAETAHEAKAAPDQPSLKEALLLLAFRDRHVRLPLLTGTAPEPAHPDDLTERAHSQPLSDLVSGVQSARRALLDALPTSRDGWRAPLDLPQPTTPLEYAHQIVLADTDLLRNVALHLFDLQRVAR